MGVEHEGCSPFSSDCRPRVVPAFAPPGLSPYGNQGTVKLSPLSLSPYIWKSTMLSLQDPSVPDYPIGGTRLGNTELILIGQKSV